MRPDGAPDRGGIAAWRAVERLRLLAYDVCLLFAFALYLIVHGPGQSALVWGVALLCAAGIALGGIAPGLRPTWLSRPLRWGAAGAAGIAAVFPLAPALVSGLPMTAAVQAHPLWPQILTTLFASRVLSEVNAQHFAALWRGPLRAPAPAAAQSGAAALALGSCFALMVYQGLALWPPADPERLGTVGLVLHALNGESAIHRAIVLLSCIIFAYLTEAALQHRRDRLMLAALRRALVRRPGDLPRLLAGPLAPFGYAPLVQALARPGQAGMPAAEAVAAFHGASRRFIRDLLPCLPLLGFLGTVVGLATAMAALPTDGGSGPVDLAGSLSGLALKFETTLLGILASLIATLLLALLEKSEQELAALCALIAAAEAGHAG